MFPKRLPRRKTAPLRRSCVGCSMLAISVRLAELGHRSIDLGQKTGGKVYVLLKTRLKESVSLG